MGELACPSGRLPAGRQTSGARVVTGTEGILAVALIGTGLPSVATGFSAGAGLAATAAAGVAGTGLQTTSWVQPRQGKPSATPTAAIHRTRFAVMVASSRSGGLPDRSFLISP